MISQLQPNPSYTEKIIQFARKFEEKKSKIPRKFSSYAFAIVPNTSEVVKLKLYLIFSTLRLR